MIFSLNLEISDLSPLPFWAVYADRTRFALEYMW